MHFIGNKKALNFVEKALERESFSQAYLFSGPEKIGKLVLAKAFAKGLIEGGGLSLGDGAQEKTPLDLSILSPEIEEKGDKKREKDITIEKIREVRKEMSLYPHSGKRKVLIVDDAHKMNVSAQNGLLKMLEEPNSTSVIILVTHEESRILATIKSRCQKIVFSLVGKEEMRVFGKSLESDVFDGYEAMSMGRPGIFSSLLSDPEKYSELEAKSSDFDRMVKSETVQKLSYAEKMSKNPSEVADTLNLWVWILRKRYLENGQGREAEYYSKMEKIEEAVSQMKNTNANARLVLENLLINI